MNADIEKRINRSWEILHQAAKEDFPMEVTIQNNSVSDPTGTYLYGRNEVSCQQLHRQLHKDIGHRGGLGPPSPVSARSGRSDGWCSQFRRSSAPAAKPNEPGVEGTPASQQF